jgi:hypothetical protein
MLAILITNAATKVVNTVASLKIEGADPSSQRTWLPLFK